MNIEPNVIVAACAASSLVLVVAAAMAYRMGWKARADEFSMMRAQSVADKAALRLHVHRADEAQELKAAEKRKADFAISEYFAANERWNEAQGRVAELEAETAAKDAEIVRLTEYQQERIAEDQAARQARESARIRDNELRKVRHARHRARERGQALVVAGTITEHLDGSRGTPAGETVA
jgi:hypothetical protein